MNRLTLSFPEPELEAAWWGDWAIRSLPRQRAALATLVVVLTGFAALDPGAYPDLWPRLAVIRVTALVLILPAFAGFVDARRSARFGQWALLASALIALGSLYAVARVVRLEASAAQLLLGIPGLVLALLALFGASGLRFAWAVPVGVASVVGFLHAMVDAPAADGRYLLLAAAGGAASVLVGSLVSGSRESHARTDFLRRRALEAERARSERLLRVLMPEALARRLADGPGPILQRAEATVVFVTVLGLEHARGSPLEAVALLDRVVGALDDDAVAAGIERIKTIGATVLFVSGGLEVDPRHLVRAAEFALRVRDRVASLGVVEGVALAARVGLHTGPVIVGVVGRTRYAYDVWGDTVNTAARLDSHGVSGRVQVTVSTAVALSDQFATEVRGDIELKGKGLATTAFLDGART